MQIRLEQAEDRAEEEKGKGVVVLAEMFTKTI